MKITVLIENTKPTCCSLPLICEHGLSFFIEFEGNNYLLDAGTTDAFIENAKLLNVPIFDAKTCILSHGHYDHSGGFGRYLRENKEANLYMMCHAMKDYYSGSGGVIHEIGIPKEVIEEHREQFVLVNGMIKIKENVYLVPHNTPNLEQIGAKAKLYKKENDSYLPDDFSHELSLVFDTQKGLVVFNSCSHGGIQNILHEVKEAFENTKEDKKIYAFFGGLHMKGKKEGVEICTFSEEEICDLIAYVRKIGMKYLYTGHCTGVMGLEMLKKNGGGLIQELTTGKMIKFATE